MNQPPRRVAAHLAGVERDRVGKTQVEVVHLGEQAPRIAEAERAGVKSVPALVVDGQVLHLNFGAAIADLK